MKCPHCGFDDPEDFTFCSECGRPRSASPADSAGSSPHGARSGPAAHAPAPAPPSPAPRPPAAPDRRGSLGQRLPGQQRPRLVGLDVPVQDREFPLDRPEVSIGRQEGCEVVVPDRSVSRVHARVRALTGDYLIEDLGSANGTWVNGVRLLGMQPLADQDTIRIGNVRFSFLSGSAVGAVPPGSMTMVADLGSEPSPFGGDSAPESLPSVPRPGAPRSDEPGAPTPPVPVPPAPAAPSVPSANADVDAFRSHVSDLQRDLDPFIRRLQALADSADTLGQGLAAGRQIGSPSTAPLRDLLVQLEAIGDPEQHRDLLLLLDELRAFPTDPALLRRLSDQLPTLSRVLHGYLRTLSVLREIARDR